MILANPKCKWPRAIEDDPRKSALEALLQSDCRPLWQNGKLRVSHVGIRSSFKAMLLTLNGRQQVDRGLEQISAILKNEAKGLEAARQMQKGAKSFRISRLLLMADDGSERFYRNCERLLMEHSDRLIGLRIEAGAQSAGDAAGPRLIDKLYGSDATAKALLLSHRDAVSQALWALLPQTTT